MEDGVDLARLAARVESLERQNRRLRRLALGIVVVASTIAAAQTLAPKPIAANRFTLTDEDGRTRAQLEMSTPGSGRAGVNPILAFSDAEGRVRVRIGLGQRGATLEVIDENGKSHEYFGGPTIRPATQ